MELQRKFERLHDLLKLDSANLQLRRECTALALQLRQFDRAIELADQGLTTEPNDDALLFTKSNALIGRQEYHAAREVLMNLQVAHPIDQAIQQNLALCCYCIGNYGEARQYLESIYAEGNREPGVIRLLVSSCHHLGLMDRAIFVADENKELARRDSALAGAYALAYLDDNRAVDAARCAAYSLRLNPRCIDALTVDATLKLAGGDTDTAKREFDDILSVNPKVGRAWIGLGSIALLHGDFARAKADLKRGLEAMPAHVGSWHMLGWTHLVAGEIDEAEKIFEHAMELDRNFAETHGALASIAAMRGQLDRAGEMIKVAQRLDPACLAAQFAQSVISAKIGNPARSQEIIGEATKALMGADAESYRRLLAIALQSNARR